MYVKVMTLITACLHYSGWVVLGRRWMQSLVVVGGDLP